jgi:hypothetical protein
MSKVKALKKVSPILQGLLIPANGAAIAKIIDVSPTLLFLGNTEIEIFVVEGVTARISLGKRARNALDEPVVGGWINFDSEGNVLKIFKRKPNAKQLLNVPAPVQKDTGTRGCTKPSLPGYV